MEKAVEWLLAPGDEVLKYPVFLFPAFLFLRWFLFEFVFKPFGRAFVPKQPNAAREAKTLHKLSESLSKIVYYAPAAFYGWKIVLQYGWLNNTRLCWTDFPTPTVEPELGVFYGVQTSYYLYCLFSHLFLDARRKDFYPMLIHHVVTLTLIWFSWQFYYLRVGALVFITMDICDVFLEMARSTNYLGWDMISNVSFVSLIIAWVYLRLYIFPVKVIKSAIFESIAVHNEEGFLEWSRPLYYTFAASLIILFFLQVFWFWLLIRVLIRIINDGKLTDVTDKEQMKDREEKLKKEAEQKKKK